MARHMQERRAFEWKAELGRLAALLGASALAIAQPVLDAFGKSPETFIFRDASGIDLVVFALVIVAVPPLVLWGAGLLVAWFAPRWRLVVHGASIGVLLALAAMQLLSEAARPVALAVAAVAALGGWVLTVRAKGFRMWSQLLAGLSAMTLVSFLVLSPSADLVTNREFDAVASQSAAKSVVLVVLDELPTASIVDADGRIDPTRFPNLARLAGDGTWYRNHTTVAGFTTEAVPAIFTGQLPEEGQDPLFTDHPDSIFRLLAGSHDLVVSESITQLCPPSVCGADPTPPGQEVVEEAGGPQMGALLHDAADLWWQRVSGSEASAEGAFGAFVEQAEPVTSTGESFGEGDTPGAVRTFQMESGAVPERLSKFLAALQPADDPVAAVIHLVSPHFPWRYLSDGTLYAAPAEGSDLPINGGNGGVPWIQDLERQRHLFQASYADAMVGQILDRVEEVGLYDDAAVVVTADHGVAFHGDENRRAAVPESLPELLWSPLIVKAPGQTEAKVDDSNLETIDIVPTIADLIGVDIPWDVDGLVAGSDEQRARCSEKTFIQIPNSADPDPVDLGEIDGDAGFAEMLSGPFPPVDPDNPLGALYGLSGYGELVGQPFEPTGEISGGTFTVDGLDELLHQSALPFVLTGTVEGGRVDEDAVVAVADGTIVGVSPVVFRNIGGPAFALLLPPDGSAGLGEVRLALVRGDELLDGGEIVD